MARGMPFGCRGGPGVPPGLGGDCPVSLMVTWYFSENLLCRWILLIFVMVLCSLPHSYSERSLKSKLLVIGTKHGSHSDSRYRDKI